MTNNDANANLNDAIDAIADAIIASDDFDVYADDIIASFRTILPPSAFVRFALCLDICPIHTCDIEICADDDDLSINRMGIESDLPLCRKYRER
jgi:hypothetical protein